MLRTVPILLYHSITDAADRRFRRWTVAPGLFGEQMAYLAEAGYHTVTVSEYGRWLRREQDLPPKTVVITFDDGFGDFATDALPVLRSHGLTSTLYLSTSYLGGTSRWLAASGEGDRPMLDWVDLDAIRGDDLELGAHGHTHRMFDTLPLAEATEDIARSKHLIEERLGSAAESFAYPHGYSTATLRQAVEGLGFSTACGVKHAMSSRTDDRFSLSRIIVDADTDVATLAALLDGKGLRTSPPSSSLAIIGWRAYRRLHTRARSTRLEVDA
jgi:peptidoglycan/xylan/chitin deacetylase (PgdA/CDA1 family)